MSRQVKPQKKWQKAVKIGSVVGIFAITIGMTVLNMVSSNLFEREALTELPSVAQFDENGKLKLAPVESPKAVQRPVERLVPTATKIADQEESTSDDVIGGNEVHEDGEHYEYLKFWHDVERKANFKADYDRDGTTTAGELLVFKNVFVASLGYRYDPATGIVHMADGKTHVKVETLTCFFNGYVPERSYIKPNCPAN